AKVVMPDVKQNAGAAAAIREPDENYLITSPGQSFYVEFDVGKTPAGERTWFAVSQGYYTEWLRGAWIKSATGKPFTPSNDALVDAKIVSPPFTALRQFGLTEPAAAYVNSSDPQPNEAARSRLKLVSHFPQGMTANIRARVLAHAGQTEPLVLQ